MNMKNGYLDLVKFDRNPFTTRYLKEEVEFYGNGEYSNNGITVKIDKGVGRLDDYLNKAYRVGEAEFPILRIDKKIWMSLTWMEVQSCFLPIELCYGEVGLGGLGLGYVPLRLAAKDDVDYIDVYEIDPRIIRYFLATFHDRPGFKKINIIEGDARKLLRDKYYDYVFMDIYKSLLMDEMLDDIRLFLGNNDIPNYMFWTKEKISLALLMRYANAREDEDGDEMEKWYYNVPIVEKAFFKMWMEADVEGVEGSKLINMYDEVWDDEYLLRAKEVFEEYYL